MWTHRTILELEEAHYCKQKKPSRSHINKMDPQLASQVMHGIADMEGGRVHVCVGGWGRSNRMTSPNTS